MVKLVSDKCMRRVHAPYMYKELMKQDWVSRHVSLGNLRINDLEMYCMMQKDFLSPAEALHGTATGRRSYSIHVLIPLGYAPLRQMTLCRLFQKRCRCHRH